MDKYDVIPRATRAGAIESFIQKAAQDSKTHFHGFNHKEAKLWVKLYESYFAGLRAIS